MFDPALRFRRISSSPDLSDPSLRAVGGDLERIRPPRAGRQKAIFFCLIVVVSGNSAYAHDIPNERVDRAIQVIVRPERLEVEYEVSLAELTLAQDLRRLIGALPPTERESIFDRYGRETGPLNAKGLLVWLDGRATSLSLRSFDFAIEQHPRYTFHFTAELPARGHLRIHDTNYVASEGSSRLAARAVDGVRLTDYDGPDDVQKIPVRAVWQLTDAEERATKQVTVEFSSSARPTARLSSLPSAPAGSLPPGPPRTEGPRLARLLERLGSVPLTVIGLIAFVLGVGHAVQPGHGKTLVAAAALNDGGHWARGIALGLVTTATHTTSVLLVALVLWLTRSTRYEQINLVLARAAGFVIAAIAVWRLGRHLGGFSEHDSANTPSWDRGRGIISLGVAGGVVPCWDAILLVVEAELLGKLSLGLFLLAAFSLGMAVVLVAVGLISARIRDMTRRLDPDGVWERRIGLLTSAILAGIGLVLMAA
jgi:ABC-type nickel/cobalt efflux system permease component RcnA